MAGKGTAGYLRRRLGLDLDAATPTFREALIFAGDVEFTGEVDYSGTIVHDLVETFEAAVTFEDAVVCESTLNVEGALTAEAALTCDTTLVVTGTTTLAGAAKTESAVTHEGVVTHEVAPVFDVGFQWINGAFEQINQWACTWNLANDDDTAGGVLAVTNAVLQALLGVTGKTLLIDKVVIDIATASSGACTVDAGVAADATTLDDTLLDGTDVNATGLTASTACQKISGTEALTVSVASGTAAGLVGTLTVFFSDMTAIA